MVIDPVAEAERRWHITLRKATANEYVGPCPFCNTGNDRFHVFLDRGNYWCRQCDAKGFVDDDQELTDHERRIRELEANQRMIERNLAETEKRLSALEIMHASQDHLRYYHNIEFHTQAIEYWDSQGMSLQTIDDYLLGYCARCPTDHEGRESYTIPVMAFGKLWNIRHRLIGGDPHDKYRPHLAGLPAMLFNADYLQSDGDSIVIVEGEKKSIVVAQSGFPNVGMMGKSGFKPEWAAKFHRFSTVYVALDPDAETQAVEIAALFKGRGRLVSLPEKVDDLITRYKATRDDIEWFIKRGMKV